VTGRTAHVASVVVTSGARWLTALVAVLLAVALVGAALVVRARHDRADAQVRHKRYGAVLAAADREATAFVNLRYDRAAESVGAVAAGATGDFRDHYDTRAAQVVRVLRSHRSSISASVVWSGVVAVSADRATVLAATTGTVSNTSTHGRPEPRHFRLRISLVRDSGRWLASDVRFVGVS
jgi:Mce-associated membrane protein